MSADRKLKILILYQGKNADDYKEKIRQHFSSKGTEPKLPFEDDKNEYFSGCETYQDIFRKALKDTDGIFAFITHDEREASSAGNLWFELGFILRKYDASRLKICKINCPRSYKQKLKNIIARFIGISLPDNMISYLQSNKFVKPTLTPCSIT